MKKQAPQKKGFVPRLTERPVFPFAAIVGQEEMKLALLLNAIDPTVGGVVIMGQRGTGKSTAVRALADLLPPIWKVRGCPFGCDPMDEENLCAECCARLSREENLPRERARVPLVDLPLGATEDRVCGAINIERALREGRMVFEPGLLARAHRGFLYIDEVNLLEDHLVDLLLDVAVTSRHRVEREGISVEHPARFVLVGSGNPEEGELRPQLIDRFGLHVEALTEDDLERRVAIIEQREAFERNPAQFRAEMEGEQERLRRQLARARKNLSRVNVPRELLQSIVELCRRLKVDGHRGELTITRAARSLAALEGRREAANEDVRRVAIMALRHRMRRDPLEQTEGPARIEQALDQIFPPSESQNKSANSKSDHRNLPPSNSGNGANDDGFAIDSQSKSERDGAKNSARNFVPPALDAVLPEENGHLKMKPKKNAHSFSSRQQKNQRRASYNNHRGRYALSTITRTDGARVALDATLRAVAKKAATGGEWLAVKENSSVAFDAARHESISSASISEARRLMLVDSLRFKKLKRKIGTLYILAVDTSGSMAQGRIREAKGALLSLLEKAYVGRDRVALVTFRGEGAEIAMPPCQSITRARRILSGLAVGGSTPLSAGLSIAFDIARRAADLFAEQIVLLLFTDGRANVPLRGGDANLNRQTWQRIIEEEIKKLGAALRGAKIETFVVDTERNRFKSNSNARALAEILQSGYAQIPFAVGEKL